jgi:hypothetical protein
VSRTHWPSSRDSMLPPLNPGRLLTVFNEGGCFFTISRFERATRVWTPAGATWLHPALSWDGPRSAARHRQGAAPHTSRRSRVPPDGRARQSPSQPAAPRCCKSTFFSAMHGREFRCILPKKHSYPTHLAGAGRGLVEWRTR